MEMILHVLDLSTLYNGRPGITPSEGGHLAECAVICYEQCGHDPMPYLDVIGLHSKRFALAGPKVTNQMRRSYADIQEATEFGASGIAALLTESCERLTIWERSPKDGGGFDYYLIPLEHTNLLDDDNFLGNPTATLEVSGRLSGTRVDIQYRINEKTRRIQNKYRPFPVYIIVVAFTESLARIERV